MTVTARIREPAGAPQGALVLLHGRGADELDLFPLLDYFDPLQLVSALRAPALVSSGGRDTTCPAETIRAVFDRIPGVKSLFHDPELTHTSSATSYGLIWQWLDRWLSQR